MYWGQYYVQKSLNEKAYIYMADTGRKALIRARALCIRRPRRNTYLVIHVPKRLFEKANKWWAEKA